MTVGQSLAKRFFHAPRTNRHRQIIERSISQTFRYPLSPKLGPYKNDAHIAFAIPELIEKVHRRNLRIINGPNHGLDRLLPIVTCDDFSRRADRPGRIACVA
jgi:hypothetical protein